MCMGDKRIVMTLDAGGTNFVFSAIRDNEEIVRPITLPAVVDDIELCLQTLLDGFRRVQAALPEKAVAISFAFPGPADYVHGIIGDLPNFPAFRGGVALGPYLQEQFQIPVYINNDGNLFAYGEALAGILPEINRQLEVSGSSKRYKHLIGVTLGTGFGAGVVIDGNLVIGDNGAGGDVWCFRNKKYPEYEFDKHKGYPTKRHLEILKEKGIIKGFYRESYGPIKKFLGLDLPLFNKIEG